jgi:glutamine amidotransferase
MQLLADESEEAPDAIGLGWMPGKILKIRGESLRLPHIGFNSVFPVDSDDPFFNGTREGSDFYFVHSYHFDPQDESDVLSRTRYGVSFVSAVRRNNIVGVQFHPEKSQSNGLQFLSNFIKFSSAF